MKYLPILFVALLSACTKKEEPPAPPPPAEPSVSPTTDEMVAAMLRGHPNSRKVCVDGNRDRAFFLYYGPLQPAGSEPDKLYHGWLFIEKVDFYQTSNKTWFITDQAENKYAQVYPDVNGLLCKDQGLL